MRFNCFISSVVFWYYAGITAGITVFGARMERKVASRTKQETRDGIEQEMLPHTDALFGYGLYLTRNRNEAEELTQETLVKAVNAFSQYEFGTNCKAWLFRIMHNTFLNMRRRDRFSKLEFEETSATLLGQREDMKAFVRVNPSPEESFVSMLSRSKVREAIEKLPSEFKEVVVLADLEGFSYKEIAEVLSCPIGTVMSRLHRGRKLLRIKLLGWARELGLVEAEEDSAAQDTVQDPEELDKVTPIALWRNRQGARPEQVEE